MDWLNEEVTDEVAKGNFSPVPDDDLIAAFDEAKLELAKASEAEPNSDWHQACFAAAYLMAIEMNKRGLINQTVH